MSAHSKHARDKRRRGKQRRRDARVANARARPTESPADELRDEVRHGDELRAFMQSMSLDDEQTARAIRLLRIDLPPLLGRIWDIGWRPWILVRFVERTVPDAVGELAAAIVAESTSYRSLGDQVAPDWMAEVDMVGRRAAPAQHRDGLTAMTQLFIDLRRLPPQPVLAPPPSRWTTDTRVAPPAHADDGLLSKVRALLAKAESTTFDAEADAFTAKAQELMTRHRIDRAHLEGDIGQPPPIGGRRIDIDNPYPETKAMLLSVVAQANNGRAVWEKKGGWATVFADPVDLDVIDELFTSLLLQATAALQREGPRRNAGTTKRFRRSFLAAYAERIGQRLFEAAQETIDEADAAAGGALVPVLDRKDEAAAEAIANAFPQTRSFSVSATDGEGWYKGVHHADQADLAAGLRLPGR